MDSINPMKIVGNWKEGYALDFHTISSEYLGIDEAGRDRFETTRSEIGQLLYELKYNQDISKAGEIVSLIKPFLIWWGIVNKIDGIIPIPPSNKNRKLQPVNELCKKISQVLNKPVYTNVIEKNTITQSKNLDDDKKRNISGTIFKKRNAKRNVNILVIDDLYQTGETLNEAVRVLKTDVNIINVYTLTMTKSRR